MVRIDVTFNVTLTRSSPSTREDVDTDGLPSRPPGEIRTLWCTGVDDSYRSAGADLRVPGTAVMAGSMPGVTASIAGSIDDTCPGS